jgi:UDP-2-acetamido-2-deoxy-ribo-hexuluronate aminotransferase
MLGARPVFADIDPVTYNIDPGRVEAVVTDKTRAVIGVSLYGQCADFASLNALAGPRGIAVIEDGCQSFGAESPGGRSCGLCLAGTTSFFPSKPLGGFGDGGMVFTDDADFADRVNKIHVHGQDRRYHHVMLGANGRLDALQAAVLLGKWPRFPGELDSRRAAGEYYTRGLEPLDRVAVPRELPGHRHVYAQYSIRVDDRDGLAAHLKSRGIPSAVHYPVPLHFQPVFKDLGYREGDFPVSEEASRRIISLPMHPFITREEQDRVIDAVKEFVNP